MSSAFSSFKYAFAYNAISGCGVLSTGGCGESIISSRRFNRPVFGNLYLKVHRRHLLFTLFFSRLNSSSLTNLLNCRRTRSRLNSSLPHGRFHQLSRQIKLSPPLVLLLLPSSSNSNHRLSTNPQEKRTDLVISPYPTRRRDFRSRFRKDLFSSWTMSSFHRRGFHRRRREYRSSWIVVV